MEKRDRYEEGNGDTEEREEKGRGEESGVLFKNSEVGLKRTRMRATAVVSIIIVAIIVESASRSYRKGT